MGTMKTVKLGLVTLKLSVLAIASCARGVDTGVTDTVDPAAAPQAEKASAVGLAIEQAERSLDVGRDIPAARAALEGALRDPAATPDQRDQARVGISRALEAEGDLEGATRAMEALLADHAADPPARWALRGVVESRLRKLVTGSELEPGQPKRDWATASAFAHALTRYFPKAESGRKIDVNVFAFGGDREVSERLGTFDVALALREDRKQACPTCDEHLDIDSSTMRSGGWLGIPMHRPKLGAALAVFYFDLGAGKIPARYDAELPIPSAEIIAKLQKGEGLIAARERPGAPPVILIAAPRRAQIPIVEEALAAKKALPLTPEAVAVPQHLQSSEIQDVVRASFPSFRTCYEDLLKRSPTAQGSIPVKFAIQPNGAVTDLAIDQATATLHDASFEQCMLGAFGAISFPGASEKTTVTYPLAFSPGE